ncbi:endothelin-converting enzyme 1-like [Amblyomma americanum]
MADAGKSRPSPRSPRLPHKSSHSHRAHDPLRSPHHGKRKKPRTRVVFDKENAASRSPVSPLSPAVYSRSASPDPPSSPRAVDWPLRFLRFSGRVYPEPPHSPSMPLESAPAEAATSPRTAPSRFVATVAVALVCMALVGTTFYVMWHRSRRPQALVATVCTTESCLNYTKLLRDAMDEDENPCDDFYQHVCGSWLSTRDSGNTVLLSAWDSFALTVASKFQTLYVPKEEQASVQKAALYWQACLSVLNSSNVPGVKQALEGAGIAWPQRSPEPDFLRTMFFMSERANMPVFIQLTTVKTNSSAYLLYFGQWAMFNQKMMSLAMMCRTKRLANHVQVLFESFGGTDHSRLSELTKQFEGMAEFFVRYSNESYRRNKKRYSNSTAFLQFTPTVSLEKWNSLYESYRGVSVGGARGVLIVGVKYFAAVFRLHQKYGDAVMNDIVEGLAVENLIAFTEPRILESFYGNAEEARRAVQSNCFAFSYDIFGYAVNHFFLRSKTVPYEQVTQLAEDVRKELSKLLSGNSSLLTRSANGSNFETVFGVMERSRPGGYLSRYADYPDMTNDPLRNWMLVVKHGKKVDKHEAPYLKHSIHDHVKFKGFRLMMPELLFPVFASDAHWAIRYGGLGARIAAALLCDYIEGSGKANEVYRANHDCLFGKVSKPVDANLQVAVACAGIVLRLFELARSKAADGDPLFMDTPHFRAEKLPFIFGCHLLCGENGGKELCNTPVRHSADFARVFDCPQDSPMNPSKKCWMLPP